MHIIHISDKSIYHLFTLNKHYGFIFIYYGCKYFGVFSDCYMMLFNWAMQSVRLLVGGFYCSFI